MEINEDDMNNMVTATAMDETTPINTPRVEDDHLQIKIQFSLSGNILNSQMISDCKLREE